MPTLNVEFAGLCLYRVNRDEEIVDIFLPDCRLGKANPKHADDSVGRAHAGYVRFNLANLDNTFEYGDPESPSYEVVHRLDRESVQFEFAGDDQQDSSFTLEIPELSSFSSGLVPLSGLDEPVPPTELLSRTYIQGGDVQSNTRSHKHGIMTFTGTIGPVRGPKSTGAFAGSITWQRRYTGDLKVRIAPFGGKGKGKTITLRPSAHDEVSLKIANLPSQDPLEWLELEDPPMEQFDDDFKWMYRLLKPANGQTMKEFLGNKQLPVPSSAVHDSVAVGDSGCTGLKIDPGT